MLKALRLLVKFILKLINLIFLHIVQITAQIFLPSLKVFFIATYHASITELLVMLFLLKIIASSMFLRLYNSIRHLTCSCGATIILCVRILWILLHYSVHLTKSSRKRISSTKGLIHMLKRLHKCTNIRKRIIKSRELSKTKSVLTEMIVKVALAVLAHFEIWFDYTLLYNIITLVLIYFSTPNNLMKLLLSRHLMIP